METVASAIRGLFIGVPIVLRKEAYQMRRVALYYVPAMVAPITVFMFQLLLLVILSFLGNDGLVIAGLIVVPLKASMTSTLGLLVILGTAVPLSTSLSGRERHSGALEGLLSTPLTTDSIWIGKTIAAWIPGAIAYLISFTAVVVVTNTLLSDVAVFTSTEILHAIPRIAVLLLCTFVGTSLVVQLAMGASRKTSVALVVTQVLVMFAALPAIALRMASGVPLNSEVVLITEILSIPILAIVAIALRRVLLDRERILLKYSA